MRRETFILIAMPALFGLGFTLTFRYLTYSGFQSRSTELRGRKAQAFEANSNRLYCHSDYL